jgi:hypothetical protein
MSKGLKLGVGARIQVCCTLVSADGLEDSSLAILKNGSLTHGSVKVNLPFFNFSIE